MIFKDVIIGATSSDVVPINKIELQARVGNGVDLNDSVIQQCLHSFKENVTYRYAYVKVQFKCENGICYFDDEPVISSSLPRVFGDSKEVFLLSVTSGIGIDKLISKATIQNSTTSYFLDAVASAGIESYIDYVTKMICNDLNVTKRFSPGYGDFPIEFQQYLLKRVSAKENLGIILSDDYLMIPTKSITAVIGIK